MILDLQPKKKQPTFLRFDHDGGENDEEMDRVRQYVDEMENEMGVEKKIAADSSSK